MLRVRNATTAATFAIFGLGNPGRRYAGTRHNAGARVLDILARRHHIRLWRRRWGAANGRGRVAGRDVWLLKPRTYMNLSGYTVAAAAEGLKLGPERILVVADDIALPLGTVRLRAKGSAGGHKGLASVIAELGTEDFARLRVGVGAPPPGVDAADYVLAPFLPAEDPILTVALERAADAAAFWLVEGAAKAMSLFND